MRPVRRWFYTVRCREGSSSSVRSLSAPSMSEIIDYAAKLYFKTWKKWPDVIEAERKSDYTFN